MPWSAQTGSTARVAGSTPAAPGNRSIPSTASPVERGGGPRDRSSL